MIFEVAEFRVKEGMEESFIRGTEASKLLFRQVPGFKGLELHQEVDDPRNFMVIASWETADHRLDMRKTELYPQIRAQVEHCFSVPPTARHTHKLVGY
ncbi:hypothetical protein ASE00_20240 [Sphingomonas sp. Root710]|uniref:putative quinol monooxygenase n=1 Tax=Sphingomonas sp. Root710 TaxID=1736594 RepID=UPI0006F55918|nr:antibiotic biosynthesis monooxygenase family protein [Sphingomonas sp. Root710]KRB79437.1 hypothetical protein ASE00_20240 [Sphingomonas sp. Root710]